MVCALALLVTACGGGSSGDVVCGDRVCDPSETASSCTEDCGCGNGVANPGEQCDGADLAGGTCMDATNHGGTLGCNADCTFDVTACTLASCGNGVAEEGEVCDGTDLGTGTCSSIGFDGGDIACTADCTYDTATCCNDTCQAGMSSCLGDTLRECVQASSGCFTLQMTDCAATDGVCESSGSTSTCTCVDRCDAVGDTRCGGTSIQTCAEVGPCLDWISTTDCATANQVCTVAPSGAVCAPDASAEDCSDPYLLSPGDNIVAWTASNADYLTSKPWCVTGTLAGPDLVLSYTAPEDGLIRFTLNKPAHAGQVFVVSSAACGTVAPDLACVYDYAPTSLSTDLAVEAGVTYYFYVRDILSSIAPPLDNPLLVTLGETLCSAIQPSVTSLSPANGSSVPDLTPIMTVDFPYPIAHTGVITVTGDLGTNLTYDFATTPDEISIVNDSKTVMIDPGIVLPANETLTVSWSGIRDSACNAAFDPPTWTFQVTGP